MTCSTGLSDDSRVWTRASARMLPNETCPPMATSPSLDRRRRSLRAFVPSQPAPALVRSRIRLVRSRIAVAADLIRDESSGEATRATPTNSRIPPTRISHQLTRKNRSPSRRIASSAEEDGYLHR